MANRTGAQGSLALPWVLFTTAQLCGGGTALPVGQMRKLRFRKSGDSQGHSATVQERQGSAQIRAGPAATHVKLSLCSLCHGHRVPCPHLQRVSLSFLSVTGLVVQKDFSQHVQWLAGKTAGQLPSPHPGGLSRG